MTLLPLPILDVGQALPPPKQLVKLQEHGSHLGRKAVADKRTITKGVGSEKCSHAWVASDGRSALALGSYRHLDLARQEPPTILPHNIRHFSRSFARNCLG